MHRQRALLVLIACLLLALAPARADDAAGIAEVEAAADGLNAAFQRQDWDYIKSNITGDHLSVFPAWGAPKTFSENLDLIPDLEMKQTVLGEPQVTLLAPNVAMRTVTVALEGSFRGKKLPEKVYKTQILVKENGRWLEKFYQATEID